MALGKEIGDIRTTLRPLNGEVSFEWEIKDFFSLSDKINSRYASHLFGFSDMCLSLVLFPNGSSRDSTSGWLDMYIKRNDSGPTKKCQYTYGIKTSHGLEKEIKSEKEFGPNDSDGKIKFCSRSMLTDQNSTLMPKNALTIKGILKSIAPNVTKGVDTFLKCMQNLMKSAENSDVSIKIQNKVYPAHRAILGARSEVFKSMLTHDMIEKNSGIITIVDCDPEIFRNFLEYIYTGSTLISTKNVFDLYVVSNKYDMETLQEECFQFMQRTLTVSTFCEVITFSVKYDDNRLLQNATEFFCENSLEILKTAEWQNFLKEYTSVGNELLVKVVSKYEGISENC